ncbi:MAG: hypothetical protein FJX73_00945 [Armatimonadetes bacterium]|nr:hypothetical protein [Armatimonadota bacterium]
MRLLGAMLFVLVGAATQPSAPIALTNVYHSLEGQTLVIHGMVENRSAASLGRLVIDATGLTPSGSAAYGGSDGIPWGVAPGRDEAFSINLFLTGQLVREYVVRVALASAPNRPLASVRRSADGSLYRPLLMSVVRLRGAVNGDLLSVRSDAGGWPVAQVTVEAVLLVPGHHAPHLRRLVLDVPADGEGRIRHGLAGAELVGLRVVDVRPKVLWED